MAKTNSPAQNAPKNGEVATPNALEMLNRELGFRAKMEAEDNGGGNRLNGIQAILATASDDATEEDFWNSDDKASIGGRDLVDVEQRIYGFTTRYGKDGTDALNNMFIDPETGKGVYLDVTAVRLDTGEEMVWNTSAGALVAKLIVAEKRGMFPLDCVIRGTDTGNGTVLKLKPLPKRAVPGTSV